LCTPVCTPFTLLLLSLLLLVLVYAPECGSIPSGFRVDGRGLRV
jgi:hypothetical protein